MASLPQVGRGERFRLVLPESTRTTGGAFQIWQGAELIYQGSSYGTIPPSPLPDLWRPLGLLQRQGTECAIFLYVPTTAEPGEYELRLATTIGSRSGSFRVG